MILTEGQKKDIIKTWGVISADPTEAMLTFYQELFTEYPETKIYFNKVDMNTLADKLAKTLGTLVNNINDLTSMREALEGLGRRHMEWGVEPQDYLFVKNSLLKTIKEGLGPLYNKEVGEAWDILITSAAAIMVNAPKNRPGTRSIGNMIKRFFGYA